MISDIKSFFYNYLHLIFGNAIISTLIGFLNLLLIVRVLSPENYGIYVLFGSVASIIAILTAWTSSSIVRFGREEFLTENSVSKTFWANYSILIPAFAIGFLLIFIFRDRLTQYIGINSDFYYLLFIFILISNLSSNITVVFQALGKMRQFAYLPLINSGIFLVALLVCYFGSLACPVELLISVFIFGYLGIVIVGIWLLRKEITPVYLSREWIKRCISYSWPLAFGGMSQQVIANVDQIVIKMFMALSFVGIYNVAYRIHDYLMLVPMQSIALMFPLMTSLIVERQEESIAQYIKNYAPQIAFIWALLLSLFIIFSRELFLIFGSDYLIASLPFSILLIGASFRIFALIESPILASYALIKEMVAISVIMGVINLGLDYWLIPLMGISGAAVATTVAFISGITLRSFIVHRKLGMNDFRNYPWILPALVSFGGSFLISSLLWRVVLLLVVIACSFISARRSTVFNTDSLAVLDSIEMPTLVRQIIRKVYSILL
jgi:O-antigen/teichoic acid export membrane protein